VGAFGTVVPKDVGAFGSVEQKDVVAAGTVQKSVSAVSHQSSVISPGLKVSDPMLEVGDGRCAGDIPPSPGCAASRPHEHTPGGAVPPGTVSLPEVTNRPPRYTIIAGMAVEYVTIFDRACTGKLIHPWSAFDWEFPRLPFRLPESIRKGNLRPHPSSRTFLTIQQCPDFSPPKET